MLMILLMITLDHPIKLAISTITTKARTPNTVIWEITQTYGNRALSDHHFDHDYDNCGHNQDDIKYDGDAFDDDIKKVDGNHDGGDDDDDSFFMMMTCSHPRRVMVLFSESQTIGADAKEEISHRCFTKDCKYNY